MTGKRVTSEKLKPRGYYPRGFNNLVRFYGPPDVGQSYHRTPPSSKALAATSGANPTLDRNSSRQKPRGVPTGRASIRVAIRQKSGQDKGEAEAVHLVGIASWRQRAITFRSGQRPGGMPE